jgi:ribosomal protein L11 methyltransferase
MKPGGILIMSGFYETDLPDIKAKANQTGLKFVMQKSKNNWIAASFSKSPG